VHYYDYDYGYAYHLILTPEENDAALLHVLLYDIQRKPNLPLDFDPMMDRQLFRLATAVRQAHEPDPDETTTLTLSLPQQGENTLVFTHNVVTAMLELGLNYALRNLRTRIPGLRFAYIPGLNHRYEARGTWYGHEFAYEHNTVDSRLTLHVATSDEDPNTIGWETELHHIAHPTFTWEEMFLRLAQNIALNPESSLMCYEFKHKDAPASLPVYKEEDALADFRNLHYGYGDTIEEARNDAYREACERAARDGLPLPTFSADDLVTPDVDKRLYPWPRPPFHVDMDGIE
jgi:hypothetical protein